MTRNFNGSSDKILLSGALLTAYPFTISAWIRTENIINDKSIFGITDTATNDENWELLCLGTVAGDPILFGTRTAGLTTGPQTTTGVSINTWHHVAAVATNSASKSAYIDGGSKATETTDSTPVGLDSTNIGVRKRATESQFWDGDIAELTVWNVALNDAEVAALARGIPARNIREAAIVGCVPIWGLHSPEIDFGAPANSWTVTGTVISNGPPVTLFTPKISAFIAIIDPQIYTRTLSDAINASDAPLRGVKAYRQMPQDAVALLDLFRRGQQHGRVTNDPLLLSDAVQRSQLHGRVTADSLVLNDVAQRVALLFHGLADSVVVSESLLRTALLFRRASDDIVITEETRRAARMFRQTTEALNVRDDTLRFAQLFRRLLDDASVTDTLTVTLTLAGVIIVTRILQDNLNITDAVQRAVRMYRLESQVVDVQDGTWYSRNIVRAVTETLTVADSVARMMLLTRVVSDPVDAADAALRFVLLNRIAREDVKATDSLVSQITYFQQLIGFVLMSLRGDPVVLALDTSSVELSFAKAEPILMEMRNL